MEKQQELMAIERGELQTASPQTLIELAIRQASSVEVLDKLLLMREREDASEAKRLFAAAYVQMKARMPKVLRTKDNQQTKSKYAPLEEINQAIDPTLQAYGFSTATKVVRQDAESVTVRAELWHSGGHVESTEVTMPLDRTGIQGTVNKTLPHAVSSSITYAKRVGICALLNISTGDDADGNGNGGAHMDDLSERIEFIHNCRNLAELDKVFATHYQVAAKAHDKNAMTALVKAKADRRKELAV